MTKELLKKKDLSLFINTENRPISRNLSINVNGNKIHRRNLNMLVVGGSGAGKTQFLARPCLMQQSGSFVITDPKGEILKSCGKMLEEAGYRILVLNLLDNVGMMKSTHYNPFVYIRSETDVLKLITNLIKNTTPKDAAPKEPFWENAEKMLYQALFYYVWMECPKEEKNFRKVMDLLEKAEFEEDARGNKLPSELDRIFLELEEREKSRNYAEGKGAICKHPAVLAYNKVMKGAADTVRSIIISANARMAVMNNDILSVLDNDEFNIPEIGAGADYDGRTKTAVFCVIPDNDDTYNFIIGMFYTQIFQQLYFYADFMTKERSLPIHVTFLLDEFANVSLPDDYLSLLSTMRSRNISSIIIIQNFAQIKAMFKDNLWENIPGNCDTLLYLGGNEQSTHEYVSKSLGEGTYDKGTTSESRGRNGSFSKSYDKFGRKLLTESEVREIDNNKCLIFIRGFKPIQDLKYDTFSHPLWYKVAKADFDYDARRYRNEKKTTGSQLVTNTMYEALKKKEDYDNQILSEDNQIHRIFEFSWEDFLDIDFNEDIPMKNIYDEAQLKKNKVNIERVKKENYDNSIKGIAGKFLKEIMILRKNDYSLEQVKAFVPLFESGIRVEQILKNFSKNMSLEEIKAYSEIFRK